MCESVSERVWGALGGHIAKKAQRFPSAAAERSSVSEKMQIECWMSPEIPN